MKRLLLLLTLLLGSPQETEDGPGQQVHCVYGRYLDMWKQPIPGPPERVVDLALFELKPLPRDTSGALPMFPLPGATICSLIPVGTVSTDRGP